MALDKFVLVLVASLALLLAGCGGGSSTTTPVDSSPTAGEMAIMQAQTALTNAEEGLSGATTDAAMLAAYRAIQTAADNLVTALSTHDGSAADIATAARKSGNAKAMADDLAEKIADAEMKANMAMVATAMKLHAGINAPSATAAAVYAADEIAVTIGTAAAVNLSADDDATVPAHHGWEGQMFTHTVPATATEGAGDTYEAVVYSYVDDPEEGATFGDTYTLDATTGETTTVTDLTGHATSRVASPSFDHSVGIKTFELPTNTVRVVLAGSYQGVAGTYYCTPTGGGTDCSAAVADQGFTLAGGIWTFKPTDPETRLMETLDNEYASYGWWIHKSEDDSEFTASAFHAYRGIDAGTVGIADLRGSATYSGGAAGKYALSSSTGGTNDAGHFTADATLEADFGEDHSISGTINNFVGADGESRDWSVALSPSVIADAGVIAGDPDDSADTAPQMTTWTMDGTAGDASGQWSGDLREQGSDGVPAIATGTFYSTFGLGGKMVGAFGVNVDD